MTYNIVVGYMALYRYKPAATASITIHNNQCSMIFLASIQVAIMLPAVVKASPHGTSESVDRSRTSAMETKRMIKMRKDITSTFLLARETGK